MKHVAVAITGASGAVYGLRLVDELLKQRCRVSLLVSGAGRQVLALEQQLDWSDDGAELEQQARRYFHADPALLHCYAEQDFTAPVASGSAAADAMVVIPASMGSVGRIACALSSNLIERVADVVLKERRPLIMVPRETPLNTLHLQNLLTLSQAGAVILPAMPAFYSQPQSMDDLVDFVVGKVLDSLGISHALFTRWGEDS
ncbi:UbiX family flavin prenyltransferase [Desulfuromonas acetoxidans]|uniref:Flavin prenyltransferase UbiX n=1 Tax=Desulfuromonas acetoxidans (strain DSM 684 / 11070) TaxID=281689 RepID=Q1K3W4_DESA6|nr:flavin prenyltransferase UbiX [Desulfuromonas acetoxidans]EAT17339.1 3-octaprenyl-4-hydroxybenzoate carboxy-lyase [Desulfuromonas acetoxidans DSM 684]MBF0644278.1 UbiX family flavin prenyltransferase [Desulfuromonas acetoxidans]NVD24852.1 UbiX family flavin prenyltransferase [Desulfuromonas acetoxidans]NVE15153.1 UbiX family flavin prenyltransferase [Desulfuromonas acetoxidans]